MSIQTKRKLKTKMNKRTNKRKLKPKMNKRKLKTKTIKRKRNKYVKRGGGLKDLNDLLTPHKDDNKAFDLDNIPQSIKEFNIYLKEKDDVLRYNMTNAVVINCAAWPGDAEDAAEEDQVMLGLSHLASPGQEYQQLVKARSSAAASKSDGDMTCLDISYTFNMVSKNANLYNQIGPFKNNYVSYLELFKTMGEQEVRPYRFSTNLAGSLIGETKRPMKYRVAPHHTKAADTAAFPHGDSGYTTSPSPPPPPPPPLPKIVATTTVDSDTVNKPRKIGRFDISSFTH